MLGFELPPVEEIIPGAAWENITAGGALVLVVLLIVTGRLIPLFYYKELKGDRDRWRVAAESLTNSVQIFSVAFPELMEVGKTTTKVMTDIREKSESSEDAT